MSLSPGTRLGPYEILAKLGAGGMGEVYRARHARLERDVAVKVVPAHMAGDASALARFELEAKAVAALSHPNILAIHDLGSEQGVSYAVMELLEGETLRDRVRTGPLPWRQAVEIGVAVADGLAAAHAKGIVHRDLKPENVFLTASGQVKVLDFGLARRVGPQDAAELGDVPTGPAVTDPGMVLGTIGYMSPEQAKGEPVGPPSDVFALGCVLHELLTGQKPFARNSAIETLAAILKDEPPPPGTLQPDVPPALDALVRQCLAKAPSARPASAREVAASLRAFISGSMVQPAFTGATLAAPRRARWPRAAAAGLLLAAGVGFAAYRAGYGVPGVPTVAVLPFSQADAGVEYLSDGVTESLINSLARVRKLRVVPRAIAFRYKGRDADPQAVGRELKAGAVLTGRVAQRGDTLTVQAELVDVAEGTQIWGEQYTRRAADILALQDQVARDVLRGLHLELGAEDQQRLARRPTSDAEAYDLYLKGRHETSKFTREGMAKGLEYFNQAILKDPGYALAYAGIAYYYLAANEWLLAPHEAVPRMREAAQKAIAHDEALAEAHTLLAVAHFWYDWDAEKAEQEFQRALALNPTDGLTLENHAQFLLWAPGRAEEGLAEIERAARLDPDAVQTRTYQGLMLVLARRPAEAVAHLQKAVAQAPQDWFTRMALGRALIDAGQVPAAIEELGRARALDDEFPETLAELGRAYAVAGRAAEARQVLEELRARAEKGYVAAYLVARVHAALGDRDAAFAALKKAMDDRSLFVTWMGADAALDPLRSDPRLAELQKRMAAGR